MGSIDPRHTETMGFTAFGIACAVCFAWVLTSSTSCALENEKTSAERNKAYAAEHAAKKVSEEITLELLRQKSAIRPQAEATE